MPKGSTYYIGEHFEIIDGVPTKYIFAGNLRIAKITSSDTQYFHKDHLQSSTAVTNELGEKLETTEYFPFGLERNRTGSSASNYKFTDQELDPESGLYNYDARLYDPVIGIFITPDTIIQDFYDSQSLSRYAYVRNNPLKYIDPTGHYRSSEFLRTTIPGQVSWDHGMTAIENQQYFKAVLHFTSMVGEQVLTALSMGAAFAEVKAAHTAGEATKALIRETAEEAIGAPISPDKALKDSKKVLKKWDQNSQRWRDSRTGKYVNDPKLPKGFGKPSKWKESSKDVSNEMIATKEGQKIYESMREASIQDNFASAFDKALKEVIKKNK